MGLGNLRGLPQLLVPIPLGQVRGVLGPVDRELSSRGDPGSMPSPTNPTNMAVFLGMGE